MEMVMKNGENGKMRSEITNGTYIKYTVVSDGMLDDYIAIFKGEEDGKMLEHCCAIFDSDDTSSVNDIFIGSTTDKDRINGNIKPATNEEKEWLDKLLRQECSMTFDQWGKVLVTILNDKGMGFKDGDYVRYTATILGEKSVFIAIFKGEEDGRMLEHCCGIIASDDEYMVGEIYLDSRVDKDIINGAIRPASNGEIAWLDNILKEKKNMAFNGKTKAVGYDGEGKEQPFKDGDYIKYTVNKYGVKTDCVSIVKEVDGDRVMEHCCAVIKSDDKDLEGEIYYRGWFDKDEDLIDIGPASDEEKEWFDKHVKEMDEMAFDKGKKKMVGCQKDCQKQVETEVHITVPEGMEIDTENSTFECIRFKPRTVKSYADVSEALFKGKDLFYINTVGDILCAQALGQCYQNLNNATTKEQLEKLLALNKLLNTAVLLNGGWKADWNDTNEKKWFLKFDTYMGKVVVDSTYTFITSPVYFKTKELAHKAMDILGSEVFKAIFNGI